MKDFFTGIGKGMKSFGNLISLIVNTLLLFIVYIIAVGPTAIIARLSGKRFLHTKIDESGESYWEDFGLTKEETEKYYRQF